ncbi:unnamed protein product [Arabis nemorensis]|uniref:Uncharacterized protein n=1 Tax=Arabis nemorensis TaxID=586526 RepID=A0A565AZB6_9BRAS|nr:unnamed protein product [Arabis nemorensis]
MGNGWQGGHGMQHHGGGHGMQHHGGGHGMEHHGGGHGMQHHGGHGMQHHGGMKHQNKLMAPQVPPHHVFMIPGHGSGNGHAMVVKENWRVSNSSSTHHKAGWGSKGL